MTDVFRFAPSPNGPLHLGHVYSALLNQTLARRAGGRLLLRIEDIDRERCRPEFEAAQRDDLAWLGITWDAAPIRQSERFDRYRQAIDQLTSQGLVYPAFLSRAEIRAHATANPNWPTDPDGAPLYPGTDRDLAESEATDRIAAGAPYAIRLKMDRAIARIGRLDWLERGAGPRGESRRIAADPVRWSDVVLARRDTPTSYHLAVVIDDADSGVTEVVRGRDLFHATAVHRLLQTLLDLPAPTYRHHRLVLGPDGTKLSKSDAATGLAGLRAAGLTPAIVRQMTGLDADAAAIADAD